MMCPVWRFDDVLKLKWKDEQNNKLIANGPLFYRVHFNLFQYHYYIGQNQDSMHVHACRTPIFKAKQIFQDFQKRD
jgi:hypothetical protein